jgi:transcriptional regulator with XRE-family HTH domain
VDFRKELGQRIEAERLRQRFTQAAAAVEAKISRDTWRRIEEGHPVQDLKLQAALDLLGLDQAGNRAVGGGAQDAQQYVESLTGERLQSGVTNEDLLREILRSRAETDRMAGRIESVESGLDALSERVAKLEESSA